MIRSILRNQQGFALFNLVFTSVLLGLWVTGLYYLGQASIINEKLRLYNDIMTGANEARDLVGQYLQTNCTTLGDIGISDPVPSDRWATLLQQAGVHSAIEIQSMYLTGSATPNTMEAPMYAAVDITATAIAHTPFGDRNVSFLPLQIYALIDPAQKIKGCIAAGSPQALAVTWHAACARDYNASDCDTQSFLDAMTYNLCLKISRSKSPPEDPNWNQAPCLVTAANLAAQQAANPNPFLPGDESSWDTYMDSLGQSIVNNLSAGGL